MPTRATLEMLNVFLYSCTASMMGSERRPGKFYVDFKCHVHRSARVHSLNLPRWSSLHLSLTRRYTGHRARSFDCANPSSAGLLTFFRTPEWWSGQQQRVDSCRHGRRHFPRLTLEEQALREGTDGVAWRPLAQDTVQWKALEPVFVRKHDNPWASNCQLSLTMQSLVCWMCTG